MVLTQDSGQKFKIFLFYVLGLNLSRTFSMILVKNLEFPYSIFQG